jgi:Domain of unknown function (DUF4330)
MEIVDDRGRLFGRLNLIDAGILIVVIVLVPLAYVSYLLFRPAPMRITSVDPNRVFEGQQPRVRIHGSNLRPYLRSQIGSAQPHTFLIESPMEGELQVPALPAGTYDLTLYDEVQEVARLKNAITIVGAPASPQVRLRVSGAFYGLDEAAARAIAVGKTFPSDGGPIEILAAAAPREDVRRIRPLAGVEPLFSVPVPGSWQVAATIRVACVPPTERRNCVVNGVSMLAGETLPMPGGPAFAVESVHADSPAASVVARVQFMGRPEVLDLMAIDDVDSWGGAGAARVLALRNRQVVSGQVSRQVSVAGMVETTMTPERVGSVDADVELPADQTPSGLSYRLTALKPGAAFTFETGRYVVRGSVVSIRPAAGDRSQ